MGWGEIAAGLLGGDSHRQARSSDPRSQQMARVNRASRINRGMATTGKSVKSSLDGRGSSGEIAKQKENRGKQDWVDQSFGSGKMTPAAKALSTKTAQKSSVKSKSYSKNPIKKSFWSESLPHAGKSYMDWAGKAGEDSMYAAGHGIDDIGPATKDYFKDAIHSLDFGLDINDGDQIIGLEDYNKKSTPDATRIFNDALSASGASIIPGSAGGVGSRIASGLAGKTIAKKAASIAAADAAFGQPLQHPAIAEGDDQMAIKALVKELGFFPEETTSVVPKAAKSLAKPAPKRVGNPVQAIPHTAPQQATANVYTGPAQPSRMVGGVQTYATNSVPMKPAGKNIFEQYDDVQRRLTPNRGVDMNRHLERMLQSGIPKEQAFAEAMKIGLRGLDDQAAAGLQH